MDGTLNAGTGAFGDQLSAALRDLALSDEYKSESDPTTHYAFSHSRNASYSSESALRPALGHKNGYMCALIDYAQGEMQGLVDDDVDADSDDGNENYRLSDLGNNEKRRSITKNERSGISSVPGTTTGAGTILVPTDGEAKFSFRITRIPYDLPDLQPQKETPSTPTPLISQPSTPSLLDDIFQPLSFVSVPDLKLELFAPPESALPSGTSSSSGGRIPHSADDEIIPGRKFSFDGSGELTPHNYQPRPGSAARGLKLARSVASLRTTTTSSSDEPPTQQVRSAFSRLRNSVRASRFLSEEDSGFLEKRSLTPVALTASSSSYHHQNESSIFDRPLPPVPSSSSSISGGTDRASSSSRSVRENDRGWYFGRKKPKAMGAVFGVDLEKSIEVAPMRIRISHSGRSNSHRIFPLSLYKCCEFIRLSDARDTTLFSSPGDAYHLDQLRRIFTTAPDYGENFTFDGTDYTLHDAARLILIYLMELPKPLVTKSVLKSWILLARQQGAIEPPCPMRIETGLDFWAEALNRLPVANRNLVKHLLGMFAEMLATKSEDGKLMAIDDASARQLSASVSRAMFHSDDSDMNSKTAVHPTLALAFMIQRRGEYIASLGKNQEKSAKNRRDSNLFLPTTKEIMQWKAPPGPGW